MSFARPDLLPFAVLVPLLLAGHMAVRPAAAPYRRGVQRRAPARPPGRCGAARFPTRGCCPHDAGRRMPGAGRRGPALGRAQCGGPLAVHERGDRRGHLPLHAGGGYRAEPAGACPPVRPALLRELPGDRFGLVVFAGRAYVLSPLTSDHSAIELYLDALDPDMVSQGGSSMCLGAGAGDRPGARFGGLGGGDRVVVLLSDGEALEDEAPIREAVERAARNGVRIMTVGFGTPGGSTIPLVDEATGAVAGQKRDEHGDVVVSRLDEGLLTDMASRTGGIYARADDAAASGPDAGAVQRHAARRGRGHHAGGAA
jgi:hypothetical protein